MLKCFHVHSHFCQQTGLRPWPDHRWLHGLGQLPPQWPGVWQVSFCLFSLSHLELEKSFLRCWKKQITSLMPIQKSYFNLEMLSTVLSLTLTQCSRQLGKWTCPMRRHDHWPIFLCLIWGSINTVITSSWDLNQCWL